VLVLRGEGLEPAVVSPPSKLFSISAKAGEWVKTGFFLSDALVGCKCGADDIVTDVDIVTGDGSNGVPAVVISVFTGILSIVMLGLDIGLSFGRLGFKCVVIVGDKTIDGSDEG
jgi:hypothetical protein